MKHAVIKEAAEVLFNEQRNPFGAFTLDAGNQYLVQFSLDGAPRDEWRMAFTVREAPPQQLAA